MSKKIPEYEEQEFKCAVSPNIDSFTVPNYLGPEFFSSGVPDEAIVGGLKFIERQYDTGVVNHIHTVMFTVPQLDDIITTLQWLRETYKR